MSLMQIRVRDITEDARNIRKTAASEKAQAELEASVAAQGVLVPLLVAASTDPAFLYRVIDGHRRLAAARKLSGDDTLVPCRVLENGNTIEAAMAGNLVREAMHPIDEYEAFSALYDTHQVTIADIAARFGKAELEVRQRLALGSVHPTIREACRDGMIPLDTLTAFASHSDREWQLKVYTSLSKQVKNRGWPIRAYEVREQLQQETYSSNDSIVKLIDIEEYRAAGGRIETDLFGRIDEDENHGGRQSTLILLDTELVARLAIQKLEEYAAQKCKGWKWVEARLKFSLRSSEFTQVAPAGKNYTKEEKANLGVVVSPSYWDGKIEVHKGLARPDDLQLVKKAQKQKAASPSNTTETTEDDGTHLSLSLEHDLALFQLEASKLALSRCADVQLMLSVLYFAMAWQAFTPNYSGVVDLVIKPNREGAYGAPAELEDLRGALIALNNSFELDWLDEDDELGSFERFLKLPAFDQKCLAAAATIMALHKVKLGDPNNHLQMLLDACGANLSDFWRPTAASFFSRIKQSERLQIAEHILGEEPPPDVKRMKKDALSLWLEDKVREMPAETCWMPPGFPPCSTTEDA